tara:strand:- start:20515 stop:21051 length:537 start_codon:yes stop_codon:yes gene_type:complete
MNFYRRLLLDSTRGRGGSGFTLIEIVVVIALMGVLATVLAVGASRLMVDREESPEDMFWFAVGEARKFALQHEIDVTLSFHNDEQVFIAATDLGTREVPLPSQQPITLDFLGVTAGEQTILIGGSLVEANLLSAVKFFRDGTCSPFRARLEIEGKQPLVLEIDPWTCAPILRDEERRF